MNNPSRPFAPARGSRRTRFTELPLRSKQRAVPAEMPLAELRRHVRRMLREARLEQRTAAQLGLEFKERYFMGKEDALVHVLQLSSIRPTARGIGGND